MNTAEENLKTPGVNISENSSDNSGSYFPLNQDKTFAVVPSPLGTHVWR